jgi:hypothetical protein
MSKLSAISSVNHAIISGQFTNDQLDSIAQAVKFARNQIAAQNKVTMRIGADVKFYNSRTGQDMIGKVTKVAIKFITVQVGGSMWRVPANMLSAA